MQVILEFEVTSPLDNESLKFKQVCIFHNWDEIEKEDEDSQASS